MKIIGTHNSMSYLPVRKWWMKPLNLIARCQSNNTQQQINSGVSCYDLRIRFDDNGEPYFCHGLVEYDGIVEVALCMLDDLAQQDDIYIRLILETSKYDWEQELKFNKYALFLQNTYKDITFFELRRKYDWKQLIPDNSNIKVVQYVNSIRCKWIPIPWLYAKVFKKKHQKDFDKYQNTDEHVSIHLFDFI